MKVLCGKVGGMTEEHPNVALLARFDPGNVAESMDVFSEEVVWHYFNPLLPGIQGDYVGQGGVQAFFDEVAKLTGGTFRVSPVSVTAVGDELVVAHTRNTMILDGTQIETDVVVVWRIVEGRITEVWDIPSVHSR
jgi:ketosteroid isomerase-like protein